MLKEQKKYEESELSHSDKAPNILFCNWIVNTFYCFFSSVENWLPSEKLFKLEFLWRENDQVMAHGNCLYA